MGSVCTDHHHKKLHHHLLSSSASKKMSHLQDVLINNIPPRKLISRTSSVESDDSSGGGCGSAYDPDSDPYSSDQFRMFEFKIRRCTRSRSHDWTDCPFAHPGEKARRRDPRKFRYSGSVCPEFRRSGACSRGDDCEFAHGVFEVWLHPSRYRTEACKDGKNCKRKVCFFAHSPRELRLLPPDSSDGEGQSGGFVGMGDVMMMRAGGAGNGTSHCCKHCNSSPRSTLHLMSPPLSPPSPSQFAWPGPPQAIHPLDEMAYEDALGEIMISLEAIDFKEAHSHGHGHGELWVDVVGVDHGVGEEQQFVLSPSTLMSHSPAVCLSSSRGYNNLSLSGGYVYDSPCSSRSGVGSGYSFDSPMSAAAGGYKEALDQAEEMQVMVAGNEQSKGGMGDPDLGWVNDLLT